MTDTQALTQNEIHQDLEDFQVFESHQRLNKKEMFENQFLDFMKWFKDDVHGKYTRKDFQRMELKHLLYRVGGLVFVLLPLYLYFHSQFPQYALVWGVPLLFLAIFFAQQGEVVHMRTHCPNKLTGYNWVDRAIDYFGLAMAGISPTLFGRRHLAAHYNDIGNVSKIFSEVWLTFDQMPLSYYSRPQTLVKFLLDPQFCREEKLDRKTLFIETTTFYIYLGALITEIFFGSYFLLIFHLLPGLVIASSQILGAVIVHSGIDNRNSFESNGIFDHHTAKGLFKVSLWFFGLLNNGFFVNHGIHHAYPQVPLDIITKNYKRYHQKILHDYTGVRYNTVISHIMFKPLLENLKKPNFFDYIVTFLLCNVALVAMMLTIMGLPVPPTVFEPLLVDYRIFVAYSKSERLACMVAFWDKMHLEERYHAIQRPNAYLEMVYGRYTQMKKYLAEHPVDEASILNRPTRTMNLG
jgi:hypothetical protein